MQFFIKTNKWILLFISMSIFISCAEEEQEESNSVNTPNAHGVWKGTYTEEGVSYDMVAYVYWNNIIAISSDAGISFEGSVSFYNNYNSVNGVISDFVNGNHRRITSYTGSFSYKDKFIGTFFSGEVFDLNYSHEHEASTSISDLAGVFASSSALETQTFVIEENGDFTGIDSAECSYNGLFQTLHPELKLYHLNFVMSNCGEKDGIYNGFSLLESINNPNDRLIFIAASNFRKLFSSELHKQ